MPIYARASAIYEYDNISGKYLSSSLFMKARITYILQVHDRYKPAGDDFSNISFNLVTSFLTGSESIPLISSFYCKILLLF